MPVPAVALFLTDGDVLTVEVRMLLFSGAGVTELLLLPEVRTARLLPMLDPDERVLLSDDVMSLLDVDDDPSPPRLVVLLAKTLSAPVSCRGPLHVST